MKGTYLGEFEELVLLAVGILYDEAYGISIKTEIEKQTNRSVSISAVHTALHRLEEKGFVKSRFGEALEIRGGKRKRLFTLTKVGIKTLKASQDLRMQMWTSLPQVIIKGI
jgi:PadR family transcriptional regulator, regulatory protein PadR